MLADRELIEAFLEASVRSQETLLANKRFLAESRFGINQLISKKAGLLIKVNVQQQPLEFWVRRGAKNYEQLYKLLELQQFITTSKYSDDGFCSDQHLPVKPGYTLNCKSARALWKNWRTLYRLNENMAQAQKLLIKSGHDWEYIKRITICDNLLFIETPVGETTNRIDDAIAWLSEVQSVPPAQPAANEVSSAPPAQLAEAAAGYVGFANGDED